MEEILQFNKWLAQNIGYIFLLCMVFNIIVLVLFVAANIKMKKYQNLLQQTEGKNLEQLLLDLLEKTDVVFKKQMKIEEMIVNNQIVEEKHLQNWSLVRFQAFHNTGGDQSFAFAVLDALGDGVVMSSIFGREEARVYCKPVQRGESTYPLSEEEKEAIVKAIGPSKKN